MLCFSDRPKGFTLIELMIVMAIIGVLAAIAVPQFASYRTKTMDAASKSALHQMSKAQEDYYLQNETYTANRASLRAATGWTVEDTMNLAINAASTASWSASAQHSSSPNTFIYSSSAGGLQ